MADVSMPRLSDTMQEGTVARWLKKPGDEVRNGEVLAQVETDKATMDLQAFESGVLQEIIAPEGATVPVGETVARIGSEAAPARPTPPRTAPSEVERKGSPPGSGPKEPEGEKAEQPPAGADGTDTVPASGQEEAPTDAGDGSQFSTHPEAKEAPSPLAGKVRASPLARRVAAEHHLDLSALHGSGPEGRIIRSDVEKALDETKAPAAADQRTASVPGPGEDDERIQLSQMRRAIGRRMLESTTSIPHFFLTSMVDATELVSLRARLDEDLGGGEMGESAPVRVSLNDLVVRAAALALQRVPEVNVSYAGEALIRHTRIHIGVAVTTPRGLIVPVVRDADRKRVTEIAGEIRDLAARAREGKLQPAEYSGGTFSVSNLGMFGVEQFSAVINPPEAAILAVGAAVREPAEYSGEIALRERMRLTLSVDHRALDGATGARYLQVLKKLLERPLLLLA